MKKNIYIFRLIFKYGISVDAVFTDFKFIKSDNKFIVEEFAVDLNPEEIHDIQKIYDNVVVPQDFIDSELTGIFLIDLIRR